MDKPRGRGDVTVTNATNSDHGIQFIGNTTIGTFNYGLSEDEKAHRQWQSVLRWLSPSDEAIKLQQFIHDEARQQRKLEETGLWFIRSEAFKNWMEGSSRLTWVNGVMGCGKTVLFFLAVERVREMCRSDESKNLGYFYCTSRGPLGQSIEVLLKSLLRQVCRQPKVPEALQNLYDLCDQGPDRRSPTVRELAKTLKEVVTSSSSSNSSSSNPQDYYFLIDGFDELEASSRDELLEELRPIFSEELPYVHFLLTSRNQREIEVSLRDPVMWNPLPVDTTAVQEDIRTFVISEIRMHPRLRRLPQHTQDKILARLVDQSNGIFRWAFLQMQSLKTLKPPVTPRKVEDKLRSLPKTLDETYTEMLNDIDDFDKPRAKRALMWLVYSARQLYVEELVDACAIDLEQNPLVDEKLTPEDLESLLQDLIFIQPPIAPNQELFEFQKHTVLLVHASIREFLVEKRPSEGASACETPYFTLLENDSNISMAQSCLAYLLYYNTYELRHHHEEYTLRRYAWYHWEDHFYTPTEHCVPTISTATLRRRARRLLGVIGSYLDQDASLVEQDLAFDDLSRGELTAFLAVMEGLKRVARSHQLDLRSLKMVLNVPFFHPDYDQFCPVTTNGEFPDKQHRHFSPQRVNSYKYRPLPEPRTWIRLLEILPAVDPDTTINCRLFDTRFEDSPPYAALSYSWGSPNDRAVLRIEGHKFEAVNSQIILLRSMRTRREDVNPAIWIDGLCINHQDRAELSDQVMIISSIFARAREVVVGLSNGDEWDDRGPHLLADLASSTSSLARPDPTGNAVNLARHTILEIDHSGGWEHILRIFKNPWWTRVWMIQEIVLGTKAVILFGPMSFNFNIVEQVMAMEDFIKGVLKEAKSPALTAIEGNPGWRGAREMTRTRLEYRRENRPLDLPMLLWRFRYQAAALSQDKVYALLGLCDPLKVGNLFADYRLDSVDVATRTSMWILQTYENLDLLSVRSAFEVDGDTAGSSWCLPFVGKPIERLPLDLGIFASISSNRIYSAAGSARWPIILPPKGPRTLTIRGMTFDKIAYVLGPARFDTSSMKSLVDLCGEISQKQSSEHVTKPDHKTIEARWRTLLANQWPFGTKLVASMHQGVKVPPLTESDEKALLNVIDPKSDLPQLEGRRVIITSEGRLGLALKDVSQGDGIVLMPGGSLAYALRAVEEGGYIFQGECYIHDCMDGQIAELASQSVNEWWTQTFNIL